MPQRKKTDRFSLLCGGLILLGIVSISGSVDAKDKYSPTLTGTLGLNTLPNARMDEKGTVRLGASTSDPYVHTFMGFQLADSFYVSLRQTGEVSSLTQDPDNLYPGLDMKLRLFEETATRPAMVVGFESVYGHKRMGSEYIALSKRIKNFDITGGIAWGRMGSAGHVNNPLSSLNSHFDKRRNHNLEQAQDIHDWFTGQDMGFFGGIEYFTPLDGLSLKAEYGANDYVGERRNIDGFDAPEPWSVSLNYKPWDQIDLSAGIIGGEKIMARLSVQDQIFNWPGKPDGKRAAPAILEQRQATGFDHAGNIGLLMSRHQPAATQIGHVARHASNNMLPDDEKIAVKLNHKGLKGPTVNLIRRDLEDAVLRHHGSPEEIWQDVVIEENNDSFLSFNDKSTHDFAFRFILDNHLNIAQIDSGPLYRSALLVDGEKIWPYGFITGARARLNIHDNLHKLRSFNIPPLLTTRSDEDNFAEQRFAIDRLYGSFLHSINDNLHMAATGGYLEEMFTGAGGEFLYRPFGKKFALGAEGWRAYKRNPESRLNKEFSTKGVTTGHVNFYYELPDQETTLYLKVGQYLREDFGGTFGAKTIFDNGATLHAFATATDEYDTDLFGNSTNMFGGIRLTLPIGNVPFLPDGSEVRFSTGPFARDSGQILNHPQPLYTVTEPIAYRQLSRSWKDLLN